MKQLQLATESIAFQSGAFFKELTHIVQDMHAARTNSSQTFAPYATRFEQCIYRHSGINTLMRAVAMGDNASVAIPALTRGNVLNSAEYAKWIAKNFKADTSFLSLERKGWVDPANARVGGAFSEIVFRMYLGHYFVEGRGYTAEEVASVILHEVGHAFTFLQFMADTVVTNHVLLRVHQELTGNNVDQKVKFILTKAADDMKIKNREWLVPVEDSTDKEVAFKILATAVAIEPRNVDNKIFFSQDSCEELADIFAIRHGAGVATVTTRAKYGYDRSKANYGIMAGAGWALLGLATFGMGVAAGAGIAAPLILGLVWGGMGAMEMHEGIKAAASAPDITGLKRSAAKVRNQLVEQLKQSALPKEDIDAAIANIDIVDRAIQQYTTNDIEPPMAVKFFDMFRRGKMDARASREYTDVLESLASNDLFIRAAQLGSQARIAAPARARDTSVVES